MILVPFCILKGWSWSESWESGCCFKALSREKLRCQAKQYMCTVLVTWMNVLLFPDPGGLSM